jgi:hypothetical protein
MDIENRKSWEGNTMPDFIKINPCVITTHTIDNSKEVWCSAVGFDGHYLVSNFGNIASLNKNIKLHHGGHWRRKGGVLAQFSDRYGYLRVALYIGGRQHQILVHRLVCMTFMPMGKYDLQVNHKDGNKKNNFIENLEWCTLQENIAHSVKFGLRGVPKRGEDSPWSKLNNLQLKELLIAYKNGGDITELAKKYSLSREYCRLICRSPKKHENIKQQIDGFYRD